LAADIEGGQVDLLLARPVARHWLVTRSLVVVLVSPIVFVSVMIAFTTLALHAFAPPNTTWPEARLIGLMGVHLVALAWSVGAFGLAVASAAERRSSALAIAAIVAVSLYLLEVLGGAWRPLARAALVSPFHYYRAPMILAGSDQVGPDLGVLAGMTVLCAAIAYWRFNGRDV
jgi:ABC-type transport system involved in multi-copper enzyme maturation permease subunit